MPIPRGSAGAFAPRSRTAPLRAAAAVLFLAIATALGATVAVGRAPVTVVTVVDPQLLTRVVPPDPVERQALPVPTSRPAIALEPVPDFALGNPSFAPRPEPDLPQAVKVIAVAPPTPRPTAQPQPAPARPSGGTAAAPARTVAPAPPPQPAAGNRVSGVASWYCQTGLSACHYAYPGGMYAAAGPALRVGNWRGRTVTVCSGGGCVRVTLVDWCQCYGSRVIDLYSDAFRQLAPLSSGTIPVTVSW